jgi:chemotaxis methyl-accepting protein methylase
MRNRPEMQLICRLMEQHGPGAKVAISVLGCSKGAEVYSILWSIRRTRPDLRVVVEAVDISQEIVDFAKEGTYSLQNHPSVGDSSGSELNDESRLVWSTFRDQGMSESESIFQRLNETEMDGMFEVSRDRATIKSWLKEGITWRVGDASAPQLIDDLGPQDIVVANRFLCHMEPAAAESCLRNVACLVKPGGYIFVSGVDLNVRINVAKELGWEPAFDFIREIHEGDSSLAKGWPFQWWGLEPFCKDRPDWRLRYASVFRVRSAAVPSPDRSGMRLVGASN